ncbi:hypothetical protein GLOTRDRAFT_25075, partial [Gloeophyllum trabeum ATCC 11539]
ALAWLELARACHQVKPGPSVGLWPGSGLARAQARASMLGEGTGTGDIPSMGLCTLLHLMATISFSQRHKAPGLQGLARASDNPSQAPSSGLSRALAWLGPAEIGPGLAWLG